MLMALRMRHQLYTESYQLLCPTCAYHLCKPQVARLPELQFKSKIGVRTLAYSRVP